MSQVEEKLAKSLTADTTELIPYLPYLLQDLWELGSTPKDIEVLIKEYIPISNNIKVLDLACGKGAVSVHLARVFGCKVKGIDITSAFIEYAKEKAQEYAVEELCDFEIEDINQSVKKEWGYDIAILGAVGDVLGNSEETLSKLKNTVRPGGYIFLDDAYCLDSLNGSYLSRNQWLRMFEQAKVKLIAEKEVDDEELEEVNRTNQECIIRRANELKAKYPGKADLFEGYIKSQQAECDELEGEIIGVTWLLQA